jgi:hypothetical protein
MTDLDWSLAASLRLSAAEMSLLVIANEELFG